MRVEGRLSYDTIEAPKGRMAEWLAAPLRRNRSIYLKVGLAAAMINFFALVTALFTMTVYDRVVPNNAFESLIALTIGLVIVLIFDFVLKLLRAYFVDVAGARIDRDIGKAIFKQILAMRFDLGKSSTGGLAGLVREIEKGQQILFDPKIQRLPVRLATYDKAPAGFPNPFKNEKLGAGVKFDADVSEKRYELVNSLFDRVITFRLKELNAAWKAIHDTEKKLGSKAGPEAKKLLAEARRLATTVPISGTEANDTFSWIGAAAFSNQAGQLRAVEAGGRIRVEGDTDGNGVADLVILVSGTTLVAADFNF